MNINKPNSAKHICSYRVKKNFFVDVISIDDFFTNCFFIQNFLNISELGAHFKMFFKFHLIEIFKKVILQIKK